MVEPSGFYTQSQKLLRLLGRFHLNCYTYNFLLTHTRIKLQYNLYDKIWQNKRFFRREELHRFFTDLAVNSLI